MRLFLLVLICMGILLILAVRRKMECLLNVVMRSILGSVAIYFINAAMVSVEISLNVGINSITLLTCGILGFPGLVALYGVGFFQIL